MRLYNLLETACIKLDLRTVLIGADAGPSYERYIEVLTEQTSLKEELQKQKNLADGMEQVGMMISLFSSASPENSTEYQHLINILAETKAKVLQLVWERKQCIIN